MNDSISTLRRYWWVILIAGVIALVIFFASCKPGDIPFTVGEWDKEVTKNLNQLGIPDTHSRFQHDYTTPQGARIKSVVQVPPQALSDIDEGLQRQITRLSGIFPNWNVYTRVSDYDVLIVHP